MSNNFRRSWITVSRYGTDLKSRIKLPNRRRVHENYESFSAGTPNDVLTSSSSSFGKKTIRPKCVAPVDQV